MIGLALVTFVATLGKGVLASDENALRSQLRTEHVVTSSERLEHRARVGGRVSGRDTGRRGRLERPRRPR